MRTPVSRLQLREHDKLWDATDILTDVGVNPNWPHTLAKGDRIAPWKGVLVALAARPTLCPPGLRASSIEL